jgi:transcriptional regulator with XRE-family HTH domain|tara:strand:- start:1331 stop:1495 length:165 start_codon:yes stop_codon:yes gene_type:complete
MNDINTRELSDDTGIDAGTLSRYIKGKVQPNSRQLVVISGALNMSVSELIALGE